MIILFAIVIIGFGLAWLDGSIDDIILFSQKGN